MAAAAGHRDRPPAPGGAARHDRAGEPPGRRCPARCFADGADARWRRGMLDDVGLEASTSRTGSSTLTVAQKHLLEIAKALAVVADACSSSTSRPRRSAQERSTLLFGACARRPPRGTAVVYITHRLAEVRELADRVTVLRDGRLRGTGRVDDITDDELLALIVGRAARLDVPAQARRRRRQAPMLRDRRPRAGRLRRRLAHAPRAARSSASPASSATARASCCARSPGSSRSPGTVTVGGTRCSSRRPAAPSRRTCPPTGTPRA